MINKNDLIKSIFIFLICIPLSYIFYWFVSLRIINIVYYIDTLPKGIFLYFCHIILFYFLTKVVFRIKLLNFEKIILILTYFIFLLLCFFDRVYIGERVINLNPFDLINTVYNNGIIVLLLNIAVFCPFYTAIKWINKNIKPRIAFIIFFLFALSIEIIQFFTMSGIFDVIDIALYVIGYYLGYLIYKFVLFEGEYR